MRKEILLVFCLFLVAAVYCDHQEGHNHGDDGHAHDDDNHADQSNKVQGQGDHSHEDQGHGNHDHGAHNHGEPGHGNQDHGAHNHGEHGHDHHAHGVHSHEHHSHGDDGVHAQDCLAHLNAAHRESGVYRIKPQGCHHAIDVLCDMETDGGGWTLIQKRGEYGNDADYFYKTWNEYKDGFGELEKEFWIGNYHINHLTEQGNYELRIDMWNLNDEHTHANYANFRTDNETRNYAIHVGNFSGDTADSLSSVNGMSFSTHDRDNDVFDASCAVQSKGAWWYKDCSSSNLNGPHLNDPSGDISQSIFWFGTDGNPILLKKTKMMVRPKP